MGTDCSAGDVGRCLKWTATRIVAENERSDPEQAERLLLWRATLSEEDLESLPLSCGKCVLAFAWTHLIDVRGDNHKKGRCRCNNNAPDNETPPCESPLLPQPGQGLPSDPNYYAEINLEEMQALTSDVVDKGSIYYERCFPAASDVTAQDISNCLWKATRRLLAEIDKEDENEKETYSTWRAIFDEGIEVVSRLSRGVLTCLLFSALDVVVGMRSRHHSEGRCSHNGLNARPDQETPNCNFHLISLPE